MHPKELLHYFKSRAKCCSAGREEVQKSSKTAVGLSWVSGHMKCFVPGYTSFIFHSGKELAKKFLRKHGDSVTCVLFALLRLLVRENRYANVHFGKKSSRYQVFVD